MARKKPTTLANRIAELERQISKDPQTSHFFWKLRRPSKPSKAIDAELKTRLSHLNYLSDEIEECRKAYDKAASHFNLGERHYPTGEVLDELSALPHVGVNLKHLVLTALGEKWKKAAYESSPEHQLYILQQTFGYRENIVKLFVHRNGKKLLVETYTLDRGTAHTIPLTKAFFERCKKAAEKFRSAREIASKYAKKYRQFMQP